MISKALDPGFRRDDGIEGDPEGEA